MARPPPRPSPQPRPALQRIRDAEEAARADAVREAAAAEAAGGGRSRAGKGPMTAAEQQREADRVRRVMRACLMIPRVILVIYSTIILHHPSILGMAWCCHRIDGPCCGAVA